jgi:hypothetical protein
MKGLSIYFRNVGPDLYHSFVNIREEAEKMIIAVATPSYARMNLFEEDVYRELQKWERCASP